MPWEIGNALVAGWRRKRLDLKQINEAWQSFKTITLRLIEVDISRAIRIGIEYDLYAYDAYVLEAAMDKRLPLLTLDASLARAAEAAGVALMEAPS